MADNVLVVPTYRFEEPDFLSKKDYEAKSSDFVEYRQIKGKHSLWTDTLIRKYLGNPDFLVDQRGTIISVAAIDRSPYILRIYRRSRVAEARNSEAWRIDSSKVIVGRSTREQVKAKPEVQRLTCILCEHERAMRETDTGWKCKFCGYETRSLD